MSQKLQDIKIIKGDEIKRRVAQQRTVEIDYMYVLICKFPDKAEKFIRNNRHRVEALQNILIAS